MTYKKRSIATCLLLASATLMLMAEDNDSKRAEKRLYYQELNGIENIYTGSSNPVALSHNSIKVATEAVLNANFKRGDFHAVDASSRHNAFSIGISGLQNFGKLDVSGSIDYVNSKDFAHKWNSTLYLMGSNPFVYGDSIDSDVNIEQFSMHAAASYRFSDVFTGALRLRYLTGSASDQTDPRPKTNAMHFEITPGAEFHVNEAHAIGVSAHVDIFRSNMSNTVVNTNNNYIYFLMKGMGDYYRRSTNDGASYPRDYSGETYKGALQWAFTPDGGNLANYLEVSYSSATEDAIDGGSAYTFRGGDYDKSVMSLSERFSFGMNNGLRHSIFVNASYATDNGYWYDQEKKVDTAHGNLEYYEILAKTKARHGIYMDATARYRMDFMRQALPDASITVLAGMESAQLKQYDTQVYKQNYTLAKFALQGSKNWNVGKFRLRSDLGGYYRASIGDRKYASVMADINDKFTAPAFEWASSSMAGFTAGVAAYMPVRVYNYDTWIGIYANADCSFYCGDSEFSSLYDSSSRAVINAGIDIKF